MGSSPLDIWFSGFLVLVWVYRGFLFLSVSSVLLDMRLFFIICSDFYSFLGAMGGPCCVVGAQEFCAKGLALCVFGAFFSMVI